MLLAGLNQETKNGLLTCRDNFRCRKLFQPELCRGLKPPASRRCVNRLLEQPALMKPFGSSGFYFFCSSCSARRTGQPVFICLTGMLWRVRSACEALWSCDAQQSNAPMNNIFCSIFHDSQLMYQKEYHFWNHVAW